MILPPDSDKEREALAELLVSPPTAHLPPPPYGASLLRISTTGSSIPYRFQPSVESLSLDVGSIAESSRSARTRDWDIRLGSPDGTSIDTEQPVVMAMQSDHVPTSPTSPTSTIASTSRIRVLEKNQDYRHPHRQSQSLKQIICGPRRKWRLRWSRRTWGMVCIASVVVIAGTIGGVFGGLKLGLSAHPPRPRHPPPSQKQVMPWNIGKVIYDPFRDGPPASDGTAIQCNVFLPLSPDDVLRSITFSPQGQNQSIASFTLPMVNVSQRTNSTAEIFVHAYGDSVGGSIEVLGAQDALLSEAIAGGPGEGQVKVDVVMKQGLNSSRALVCSMQKTDGSIGVGVYSNVLSNDSANILVAPDPSLSFLIVIRFPASTTSPSYVNNFRLQSSIMGINMGDMRSIVGFGNLTGEVGRGGISVTHVAAAHTRLTTGISTLRGTFNVSESLTLTTSDGGLLARSILHNPRLTINPFNHTSPSQTLFGDVGVFARDRTLENSAAHVALNSNAAFDFDTVPLQTIQVNASTTNGPLYMSYQQDPGVRLISECSTSNGVSYVEHDPSWQGTFLVRSLNGLLRIPDVNSLSAPTDPWNLRRQQAVGFFQGSSQGYYLNGTFLQGSSRGDAVFNDVLQSWEVSGMSYWLDKDELSGVNITALAGDIARECTDTCTGTDFIRSSHSIVATSWGDATLSLTGQQ